MAKTERKLIALSRIESRATQMGGTANISTDAESSGLFQEVIMLYEGYRTKYGAPSDYTMQEPSSAAPTKSRWRPRRPQGRERRRMNATYAERSLNMSLAPETNGLSSDESEGEEPSSSDESRRYVKGQRRARSAMKGVYEDVSNYNAALKSMNRRDWSRLAKNRNTVQDLYSSEASWLQQMKAEVSNTSYGFCRHKL